MLHWVAQHPVRNHAPLYTNLPIFVELFSFQSCYIPEYSPGPCIINRGCYNSTLCLRTEHWKPAWTRELMRPKPKITKDIRPSPDRRYPERRLYRPEKVTKLEVTFNKEQFKVT